MGEGRTSTLESVLNLIVCAYIHVHHCRFSSRVRRKTDFFVPVCQGDENGDGEVGRGRGKRRQAGRVPSVVRKLLFEPQQLPLVAAPPDVPQALVVGKSCNGGQGEQDDTESQECREDIVVKEDCSGKVVNQIFLCQLHVGRSMTGPRIGINGDL